MTVRTAELLAAILLALAAIAFMVKASENYILWVPLRGPGAGAWPFWLSLGMLLTCLWNIFRWFRGSTPESRSDKIFMSSGAVYIVGVSVAALFLLILGSAYIGIYFSLILFLFFFIRIVGKNGMLTSVMLSIFLPIGLFLFFEWALKIPLPKGISEPLFYPIYRIIY
jgi:putative tricarboxylic transport membrane protein